MAALARDATAQTLYAPRAVKATYANGTRSLDGRPGAKYWQNHGRYTISIATSPPDRRVSGTEQITYTNNSPDTLASIVIKLLDNFHKAGAPRDGGTSADFLTSGVHVRSFEVNGKEQKWAGGPNVFTSATVKLPSPLLPHTSVQLAFEWWYDLSLRPGREGAIDSTTFYVAYFYPRVAV
ncbi:MAG: M1 family peptidase, partial [Gemmatimonadaceae bacterium]